MKRGRIFLRRMQTVVVFDCERRPAPAGARRPLGLRGGDAGGALRAHPVHVRRRARARRRAAARALARAAGARRRQKIVCWRDKAVPGASTDHSPFSPLLLAFDEATLIVGYNAFDFDFPLLRNYRSAARCRAHRLKARPVRRHPRAHGALGVLDTLLKSNGLQTKNGLTGLDAVRLWDEVQYAEVPEAALRARKALEKYCESDVRCTAQLITRPALALRAVGGQPGVVLPTQRLWRRGARRAAVGGACALALRVGARRPRCDRRSRPPPPRSGDRASSWSRPRARRDHLGGRVPVGAVGRVVGSMPPSMKARLAVTATPPSSCRKRARWWSPCRRRFQRVLVDRAGQRGRAQLGREVRVGLAALRGHNRPLVQPERSSTSIASMACSSASVCSLSVIS